MSLEVPFCLFTIASSLFPSTLSPLCRFPWLPLLFQQLECPSEPRPPPLPSQVWLGWRTPICSWIRDMGSQSSTFSLLCVPYLSQAWCTGVAVGGETRGIQPTGYFLPRLPRPGCPRTCQTPASCPPLLCVSAQWRGKDLLCSVRYNFSTCLPFKTFGSQYHLLMGQWALTRLGFGLEGIGMKGQFSSNREDQAGTGTGGMHGTQGSREHSQLRVSLERPPEILLRGLNSFSFAIQLAPDLRQEL